MRLDQSSAPSTSRAAVRSPSSSPSGRRMASYISSPIGRVGGIFIGGGMSRVEALCPDGGGVRPAAMDLRHVYVRFRVRRVHHLPVHPRWRVAPGEFDTATLQLSEIETPYTYINSVCAEAGRALFIAGSPTQTLSVVQLDLKSQQREVLRRASAIDVDPGYVSLPLEIEFPTEGGQIAYGFFYPPYNKDFSAPPGDKPPLLVMSHGGPTGATISVFDAGIQYWTSRGIAVLDVNYGGSTGYGRAYRQRLYGQWGVMDVDDCVNGARYLVERGQVDGNRLIITGGSAGGYTTSVRPHLSQFLQSGRELTSASVTWSRSSKIRTSSSLATSTISSAPTRRGATCMWNARPSTSSTGWHAPSFSFKARKTKSFHRINPARCTRPGGLKESRWLIWSSRANSMAFARRRTSNVRSMPSVFLLQSIRFPIARSGRAGID